MSFLDEIKKYSETVGNDILPKFLEDPEIMGQILLHGISQLAMSGKLPLSTFAVAHDVSRGDEIGNILAHIAKKENEKFRAYRLDHILNEMTNNDEFVEVIQVKSVGK